MLPAKILIISADASMTISVSTCLKQSGYQVIHTSRGAGAIDLIQVEKPNLIIIDMELHDYNSLAIIRSLRSEEFNDRTPVVLISTHMREKDVLIGLEVGADLCLLETFHPQVFVARVRSLMRRTEPSKVH